MAKLVDCTAWLVMLSTGLVASPVFAQSVRADHTTVDVDALSPEQLAAAKALRMSLSHASVGGNIWDGLSALAADSTYEHPNWTDNDRGNPGWEAKVTQLETWVDEHASDYDVFQNKFCFIDQDADFDTYRDSMESLRTQYPDKVFVWWTMPLQTGGAENAQREAFNTLVRSHTADASLPLFDLADIESHTVAGAPVTESGAEAMDPAQSSDGGHLNDLGAARAAAAQWALMAQLATGAAGAAGGGASGAAGLGQDVGGGAGGSAGGSADEGGGSGCSVRSGASCSWGTAVVWAACALLVTRRRRWTSSN